MFDLLRGELSLIDGDAARAERSFQRCTAKAPDLPLAWGRLGDLAAAAGRMDDAIACYERLVHLLPGDGEARERLADALLAGGRREDAITRYEEALARRPDGALAARIAALRGPPASEADAVPGRIGALGWSATGGTVSPVEASRRRARAS